MGQQDLLAALEAFARPEDGSRADQVLYVTHSPFLINKNAAHRIRVLDKGSNEEGTRVVRDVARNHYEPLRSSVGTFVAETAFIGGANLMVEGPADQVLLAGLASSLRLRDVAPRLLLDLNRVTIVPAGSASSVPYMVYLARGRDEIKPACVALLDGDTAGTDAIRSLCRRVDGRGKPILSERYVVNLAAWARDAELELADQVTVVETEDLIPVPVAVEAARAYATRLLGYSDDDARRLDTDMVNTALGGDSGGRLWPAIERCFAAAFEGANLDKVGFAKEVVAFVEETRHQPSRPARVPALQANFGALIAHLAALLREADTEEAARRGDRTTDRLVRAFLRDHPDAASRDAADQILRDIEASLDHTAGDEAVRSDLAALRRDFQLHTNPLTPVAGFADFAERLGQLKARRRQAFQEAATARPGRRTGAPE